MSKKKDTESFNYYISECYRLRELKRWEEALDCLDQAEKLAPVVFRKPNSWLMAIDRMRDSITKGSK